MRSKGRKVVQTVKENGLMIVITDRGPVKEDDALDLAPGDGAAAQEDGVADPDHGSVMMIGVAQDPNPGEGDLDLAEEMAGEIHGGRDLGHGEKMSEMIEGEKMSEMIEGDLDQGGADPDQNAVDHHHHRGTYLHGDQRSR